jgi:hypothetical protein
VNYGYVSSLFDMMEDPDLAEASLLDDIAQAVPLPVSAAAALMLLGARDPVPCWPEEQLRRLLNLAGNQLPEVRRYLTAAIWLVAREESNRRTLHKLGMHLARSCRCFTSFEGSRSIPSGASQVW